MIRRSGPLSVVGATVLTDAGTLDAATVHVADGRIAATAAEDSTAIDVSGVPGALVVPGLVDLHVHVFRGQEAGIDPDEVGARTGVTTMLDAGSAGAHLIDAFRTTTIDPARTRVRAMINISTIGITSFRLRGELHEPAYADVDAVVAAVERHRDVVHGIKVRASHDVGGTHVSAALRLARQAADATRVPLMVHLGPAPCDLEEILSVLGRDDILTHSFSGWPGNTLLDRTGRPRGSVVAARERGVAFDLGYGASGFDADTASTLIDAGFFPDTISTDLHAHNARIDGLPTVLTQLWRLGLPLLDVLTRATHRPGALLGVDGVGRLTPGVSRGDVTVLARRPDRADAGSEPTTLDCVLTIRDGEVVHDSRSDSER